ncbi:hypothetical protein D3C81_1755960 [compost metagenome]
MTTSVSLADCEVGRVVPVGLVAVTTTNSGAVPVGACLPKNSPLASESRSIEQGTGGLPRPRVLR